MRVTVTDTETVLVENVRNPQATRDDTPVAYLIDDPTGTAVMLLAKTSGELAAAGFQWSFSRGALSVTLEPGERLLARRTSAGSTVLHTLAMGRP